jgi:hypothetical protein
VVDCHFLGAIAVLATVFQDAPRRPTAGVSEVIAVPARSLAQ